MAKQANTSKAFERFEATMDRSNSLFDLYDRLIKVRFTKAPKKLVHDDLADLVRSGVVFAVAAMDSYFTGRFAELLVPYLKKHGPTKGLVELLSEAGLDTRQALEMIEMERPYRRIRTLMDSYFDRYTTQRAEVIDELFLAYGIADFTNNAQKTIRRKNLVRRVELTVMRRHQIVHEGDLNANGGLRIIDASKCKGQVLDIEKFVKASHDLTIKRMK